MAPKELDVFDRDQLVPDFRARCRPFRHARRRKLQDLLRHPGQEEEEPFQEEPGGQLQQRSVCATFFMLNCLLQFDYQKPRASK